MRLTKYTFYAALPMLRKAVADADFIALRILHSGVPLDLQTSGLNELNFLRIRRDVSEAIPFQLGLTAAKRDNKGIICSTFNLDLFPLRERTFNVHLSEFDALKKKGFDFNKAIYEGIPFTSMQSHAMAKAKAVAIAEKNKGRPVTKMYFYKHVFTFLHRVCYNNF